MTRPVNGGAPRRQQSVLRGVVMGAAIALGLVAVWLIVTADTQKGTRIGALLGFWALLGAAFAYSGTRHSPVTYDESGHDGGPYARGELARLDDVAMRREHELRLEEMLRREIQVALGSQLATLRAEVSALRGELVEKVGGQLRLERIETTRVIGSDIEALQDEVRRMRTGNQLQPELTSYSLDTTHTSSFVAPLDDATRVVPLEPARAWVSAAEPSAPEPSGPEPSGPEPSGPEPWVPGPVSPEPIAPQPSPSEPVTPHPARPQPVDPQPVDPQPFVPDPVQPATPEPPPLSSTPPPWSTPPPSPPAPSPPPPDNDPFAAMPRLRPFTEFDLDPIDTSPDPNGYSGANLNGYSGVDLHGFGSVDLAGFNGPDFGDFSSPQLSGFGGGEVNGYRGPDLNGYAGLDPGGHLGGGRSNGTPAAPAEAAAHGAAVAREPDSTTTGRHATGDGSAANVDSTTTGGRRRSSGANDDILARILQRENPPNQ
jgi:hypothetical protein